MKITFLGTGTSQGIPVIGCKCPTCQSTNPHDKRLRCSVYIKTKAAQFVIDIGPDFRNQCISNSIDHIDFALLTHEHSDHTAGLDDIRPINFSSGKHLEIYGLDRVINDIKDRFGYIFNPNPYPGAPRIRPIAIDVKHNLDIMGCTIIPIKINHGPLPILGYRINNFAYLTDVKTIPETEYDKLKNLDVLAISALRHEHHFTHLTLEESIEIIDRINPKSAYLIHMSHTLGPVKEWSKLLPKNIYPSYDGLTLEL